MKRVIDAAKAVAIPMDREVIHVIPQEFIIDDQDGIREPLGMSGVRLEAKIHIVTAAVTSAQNIVKCANKAGLNVMDIVLEPLASAEACAGRGRARPRRLPDRHRRRHHGHRGLRRRLDQAHLGARAGRLPHLQRHRGGAAHALRGGRADQEEVRRGLGPLPGQRRRHQRARAWAAAARGRSRARSCARSSSRASRRSSRWRARSWCKEGLEDRIPSGVVLTGGCSALEGMPELAEEIFEAPVRLGMPSHVGGLQDVVRGPMYATGVGPGRSSGPSQDREASAASGSATSRSSAGSSSACGTGSTSSSSERRQQAARVESPPFDREAAVRSGNGRKMCGPEPSQERGFLYHSRERQDRAGG